MARILYTSVATSGSSPAIAIDPGQAVGTDDDRVIKKIFVGAPVAGASFTIFKQNNALASDTTNIAFKYTYPSAFAAGTPAQQDFDFTPNSGNGASQGQVEGMVLGQGGSIVSSSAMQITVLWDLPDA